MSWPPDVIVAGMVAFLAAIGAMALKDSVITVLVIAEARGWARVAAGLAAVADLAGLLVTITSAGLVLKHGWTVQAAGVLVAIMVTSAAGTWFWTRVGNRIARQGEQGIHDHPEAEVPDLARRVAALEQTIKEGKEVEPSGAQAA